MEICKGLKLNPNKREILSFVGGGGKTTTIFTLGEELKYLGKKVLITTSTNISNPKEGYDYYFLGNIPGDFKPTNGSITIVGEEAKGRKLVGLSLKKLDKIIEDKIFHYILIEADGAKRMPIKALAKHEPVVSKYTTKTFGIIGIDSLDKLIKKIVHRPELFIKIVDKNLDEKVLEEDIVKLVLHSKGLFKDAKGEKILFLNKINNEEALARGYKIRKELEKKAFPGMIILGDIKKGVFY